MKVSPEFVIRQIAGEYVVIATGKMAVKFRGMITINESAICLWKALQNGCGENDLVQVFLEGYDIDEDTARTDVKEFLQVLRENGILIE